jgi:hypothetical protein
MKITLLTLSFLALRAAAEPPAKLLELMRNPSDLSGMYTGAFTVPRDRGAILFGPGFVSFLSLVELPGRGAASYQFRTFSRVHKLEVRGEGELLEKYHRISDPAQPQEGFHMVDKGSQLVIDAGLFKIRWSAGRHLYAQAGQVKIQAGTEKDYLALVEKEK